MVGLTSTVFSLFLLVANMPGSECRPSARTLDLFQVYRSGSTFEKIRAMRELKKEHLSTDLRQPFLDDAKKVDLFNVLEWILRGTTRAEEEQIYLLRNQIEFYAEEIFTHDVDRLIYSDDDFQRANDSVLKALEEMELGLNTELMFKLTPPEDTQTLRRISEKRKEVRSVSRFIRNMRDFYEILSLMPQADEGLKLQFSNILEQRFLQVMNTPDLEFQHSQNRSDLAALRSQVQDEFRMRLLQILLLNDDTQIEKLVDHLNLRVVALHRLQPDGAPALLQLNGISEEAREVLRMYGLS